MSINIFARKKGTGKALRAPRSKALRKALAARLLSNIKVTGFAPDECWVWQGCKDREGYGKIKVEGETLWVHRVAYALWRETIKAGLEIDHVCRNTSCIRPKHLQALTTRENTKLRDERYRASLPAMKSFDPEAGF